MRTHPRSHYSDGRLLSRLQTLIARGNVNTAEVLACIAEVDDRKLYLAAGYPSMFTYCVAVLHLSEEAAFKRIHAARAARRFPALFKAVAAGRLHLSAVVLLAPHLTDENAEQLIAAATHKSKAQIEHLLAQCFPRPDVLAWVQEMPAPSAPDPEPHDPGASQHAPGRVEVLAAPAQRAPSTPRPMDRSTVKPLSSQSFEVCFTFSKSAHEKLQYALELLSHQVSPRDFAAVFERALDALIPQLEKRKFAATSKPRKPNPRKSTSSRHIPAHVKRAVWERDQGQCTFVSDTGRRCEARSRLEFDHVQILARGGEASVAGIRLRCRSHNQYTAECTFGSEFMRHKRQSARGRRAKEAAYG